MIVVEGTERSQQNARLRLAWLARLALCARNQALAYGSRGSRFAQMYQKPKFDFFFGNKYPKIIPKYQNSGPKYQNSLSKYQNYVPKFFLQKLQIKVPNLIFLGRTCILYSKYVYVSTHWRVDGHK